MPPGFGVATRGMRGPECKHVTEAIDCFTEDELSRGGIVDFILGAEPGPGVFVIGYNDNPTLAQYASYLKMGDGPYYTFYIPVSPAAPRVPADGGTGGVIRRCGDRATGRTLLRKC